MRLVGICILMAALTSLASECSAQTPLAVLSWGADCPSPLRNRNFAGPGSYPLWVWVKNLTSANESVGFQVFLTGNATFGEVPDAWRFDDAGCQQGRYISDQNGTCPAMTGPNSVNTVHVEYDATGKRTAFRFRTTP